jgi:hypothetical protein
MGLSSGVYLELAIIIYLEKATAKSILGLKNSNGVVATYVLLCTHSELKIAGSHPHLKLNLNCYCVELCRYVPK